MGIILGKVDRHELGEALSREVHYFADRSRDGIMIWVRKEKDQMLYKSVSYTHLRAHETRV